MYLSFVSQQNPVGYSKSIEHLVAIFNERLEHARKMRRKYGRSYDETITNMEACLSDLQSIDFSYIIDFCQ